VERGYGKNRMVEKYQVDQGTLSIIIIGKEQNNK
jgi:hypothetical protein